MLVQRDNTVKQFFKYDLQGATYYTNAGWILPVVGDRLVTAYYKGRISEHGYRVAPPSALRS